jgi:glycosyltransferase involved in cell wall biosynthesis
MSQVPIAIAMPVHNGEKWLSATLDSLVGQSDEGLEVVIRDSTPGTGCADIVDTYRDRLNIDYAHWPDVPSWTRKTNEAAKAAKADYVCSLHQDDLWSPDRLKIARELIAANPDAVMLCSPAHLVDAAGNEVGQWNPPLPQGEVPREMLLERLIVQNFIAMPSPIIRRDAYLTVGGLDEELWYTPDWDLYLKLAEYGPVVFDERPTTSFRLHGGSLTLTGDREEFAAQLKLVVDRYAAKVSAKSLKLGRASVRVNTLLADASRGDNRALAKAAWTVVSLGLGDASRYLKFSRLRERMYPRLRLRMKGMI